MAYLRKNDYYHLIQESNLDQVISRDVAILEKAQDIAIAEIKGYLSARFEVDSELKDVTDFRNSATYTAGQTIYLDGEEYDDGKTYSVDELVVDHLDDVYICIQSGVDKINDPLYFTLLGKANEMFYSAFPSTPYNYRTEYLKDAEVFYKGKEYTAVLPNTGIKPDDVNLGVKYWGNGTVYTFTGQLVTDEDYWTHGDLRNAHLLMTAINLTLYHVHCRIAPRNIPDLRVKAYDDAIMWLTKCSDGRVIPNLELIRPKSETSGTRTRFGYKSKNQNNY